MLFGFFSFYKMGSQSGETVGQTKETFKNGKKKWTDDKVQDLIELFEEKSCLWDIFSREYTKTEVKEKVYAELAEHFDSSSAIAEAKIKASKVQLGREMAKESKTKSHYKVITFFLMVVQHVGLVFPRLYCKLCGPKIITLL